MASSVADKNSNNLFKGKFRVESPLYNHKNDILPSAYLIQKKYNRINSRDGLPHSFQTNHGNSIEPDEREEIQEFFNKRYKFEAVESEWVLPDVDKMFTSERWHLDEMMQMKEQLNEVKNKLNDFDLELWHRHTKNMNKAGNVMRAIRNDINAEFVTQAWCKFYEICHSYSFVCETAREENELNSVHICEAPGAFITSLNHYLKLNHPNIKWNWISTTLNPYHEGNPLPKMINDDRFILHTLDHWKFGEDYTGNLMEIRNLHHLVQESKKLGPILMITADGSIDCQNDPGEQESIVYQLIFCEVVSALHILSIGGNFVVKMFTMYEAETICLMYLLVCCFKHVDVFKPATSKEGNSENYVVCLHYKGVDKLRPWLQKLLSKYSSVVAKEMMFSLEDIPKDFIKQQKECAEKFKNYQVEVIERNIRLYDTQLDHKYSKRMKRLSYLVADEFKSRYCLKPIDDKFQIVGENVLRLTELPNIDAKVSGGSFNDQQQRQKIRGVEKLKLLFDEMKQMQIQWKYEEDIKWLEFQNYSNKFNIVSGKPVTSVHCSKFCLGKVLTLKNEIRNLAKELNHVSHKTGPSDTQSELYSQELSSQVKEIIQKCEPALLKKLKVLNYKEKLWASLESGKNEDFERTVFFDIMDLIESLWRDESFVLQGYPMLTQFTAGVVYMIGHLFEKVGFLRPTGQDFAVIFHNYRSWNLKMKNLLKELDHEIEKLEDNKSVLAVIPLTEIVHGHKEFYSSVTAINSYCVQEQNRDVIMQMIASYGQRQ